MLHVLACAIVQLLIGILLLEITGVDALIAATPRASTAVYPAAFRVLLMC